MAEWSLIPEKRQEAIERSLNNSPPLPAGLRVLGRWHKTDVSGGYTVLESEDAKALAAYAASWSDVLPIRHWPVVQDADAAEILAPLLK